MGCLLWVPIVVFAEYLGIDYLKSAYGMSSEQAAMANAMIFIGMASGGPLVTSLSNTLQSRLLPIKVGSVISTVCMSLVLYFTNMPVVLLFLCLYLTGLSTSTDHRVSYGRRNRNQKISRHSDGADQMVMISGIIFQPLTGYLLNITDSNALSHSASDFQFAFSYIPFAIILTLAVALLTQETYRTQSDEESADLS